MTAQFHQTEACTFLFQLLVTYGYKAGFLCDDVGVGKTGILL